MATSGSIYAVYVKSDWGSVEATLSWQRTGYSVANNTSTIKWTFSLKSWGDTLFWNSGYAYRIHINGKQYEGNANPDIASGESKVLAEGEQIITHSSSGVQSFSYDFTYQQPLLLGAGWASASGTGTLDAIPQKATIVAAPDFNDEENPTITYSNPSGTKVDKVEACISFTGEKDDIPYREINKSTTSYTFNLTDNERTILRNAMKSSIRKTVRFYIKTTIEGETFWSYITKTLTLVNYTPTLSPTVKDINPTTTALTGDVNKLVRYYSNAQVDFGAVAQKGATIAKKIAINGSQEVSIEGAERSAVINNVDDNVFSLSATDTRGYTTSQQVHFKGDNFIPYFKVTCNQTIQLTLNKTIEMTVKGNYYNGSFGAQSNTLTVQTRHKEGDTWSDWEDISALISERSNGTYTLNATLSGYDPSGTYDFQCRALDKLTSAESAVDTITLEPIFDWSKNDFNFNVPVTIEGNTIGDFVIETGTEEMGSNGTWYWSKWKSGKAECYGCRNFGNMAVTTAWGGLYRSTTFTQDLPSGLFTATPEVIDISLRSTGNYGGWIVRHEESAPSDSSSGSFIVVRPASATLQQAYISFNIIGRWK